ncbi:MAG: hypothetical protein M1828_002225 [Chrysothrix sp. TS-e1954]|nr:MAG: hypothetical protein M1828_002225 [Chrysothrix sp. TS-e1954]
MAIDRKDGCFRETMKPFKTIVFELCSPLIYLESKSGIILPVHASLCEYLSSVMPEHLQDCNTQRFFASDQDAHGHLARDCIHYLSAAVCLTTESKITDRQTTLKDYACFYWIEHVLKSRNTNEMKKLADTTLASDVGRAWMKHYIFDQAHLFPLQSLLRGLKSIAGWKAASKVVSRPCCWEWTSQILDLLLEIETLDMHIEEKRISYFERLMVMRDLAREVNQMGRLKDAIERFETYLALAEQSHGSIDIRLVWLLNVLGLLYDQEHLVEVAMRAQRRALEIQIEKLGPIHHEANWTRNELGRMYRHLGRLEEAEQAHLDALSVLREVASLSPMETELAWTLSTLGRVYRLQERYDLAITSFEEARRVRIAVLGWEHPHSLWLLGDIGQSYFENGNLKESASWHDKALEGRRKVLGDTHPDTCWTMNDLGIVLADLGKTSACFEHLQRAVTLQREALQGQRQVLGNLHPHTVWTEDVLRRLELTS